MPVPTGATTDSAPTGTSTSTQNAASLPEGAAPDDTIIETSSDNEDATGTGSEEHSALRPEPSPAPTAGKIHPIANGAEAHGQPTKPQSGSALLGALGSPVLSPAPLVAALVALAIVVGVFAYLVPSSRAFLYRCCCCCCLVVARRTGIRSLPMPAASSGILKRASAGALHPAGIFYPPPSRSVCPPLPPAQSPTLVYPHPHHRSFGARQVPGLICRHGGLPAHERARR